jgi:nucleotide-binding universal stress UspA family protein
MALVHIINKDTRQHLKKEGLKIQDLENNLKELADKYGNEHDINTSYILREGSIFTSINEIAQEKNAELVILGTHGKVGFQHLFGSYAMKIVTKSPSPVIVVQKRPFGKGYRNIVFPIAAFLEDRQKVHWAVFLAKTFDSQIHLFLKNESDPNFINRIDVISAQIEEEFQKQHIKYLRTTAEKRGNFADQILEYSTSKLADLIMIMTEPEVPDPDTSIAPWVETLIFNNAQIPVMCMNPLALSKFYYPL